MDPSADITRFRTRNLNWIERSRLFCYSVINFLYWTSFSSFAFELQKLLYFITSSCVCQALFLFVFNQDSKENVFSKTHFFTSLINVKKSIYGRLFFSKPLLSQATLIFYHMTFLLSSTFLFSFVFLPKKAKENTEKEGFEPSHRVNGLHP